MNDRFDCAVLGGGPAGSVAAALASRAGLRTVLIERDRQPHAGPAESLTPEAAEILAELGALNGTARRHFARRDLVHRLWDAANARGAKLVTDAQAAKVLFSGDRVSAVRVELPTGELADIPCSQVIDASGHDALLATQLKLKLPELRRQAVIWGAYAGVTASVNHAAGESCCCPAGCGRATFRIVEQEDDLACLSLVGDAAYLLEGRGAPEEIFEDELVICPAFAERLIQARLVDRFLVAIYQPFTVRQNEGNGWRIIGDAREPADPLDPAALARAVLAGRQAAESLTGTPRRPVAPWRMSVPASGSAC